MVDLYSISGFFAQNQASTEFGGFFVNDNGRITGNLLDFWGPSHIEGELGVDQLNFVKTYSRRADINCNFRRTVNGIWVGEYSGMDCGRDKSICRINKDFFDLETKIYEDDDFPRIRQILIDLNKFS